MNYAIALKDSPNPNRPSMGYIKPFFKEKNGEISVSKPEDFPNRNSIVVFSGYDKLDEEFDENELFKIPYSEADAGVSIDRESPNYSWYRANGNEAKRLGNLEFFHIVDANVDFDNRQILNLSYKPVRAIFVAQERLPKYLFGPFHYTYEQNLDGNYTISLEPYPKLTQVDSSYDWFILKIDKTKFDIVEIDYQKIWACSIQDLADTDYEIIDFISDEQLVKWANDLIPPESRITKRELSELKNSIQSNQLYDSVVEKDRVKRVVELFDKLEIWQEDRSTLISQFLSTEDGQKSIAQYLDVNRKIFEDELDEKYRDRKEKYEKEISELEQRKQEKQTSLTILEAEFEATKDSVNQRKQQELDEQRLNLQSEVEALHKQLNILKEKLNISGEIEDLRNEVEYGERRKREIEEGISKLETQRRQLTRGIQEDQNELLKKLTDLKTYIDVLNGLEIGAEKAVKLRKDIINRQDVPATLKELIAEIQLNLRTYGRDYDTESVANYLINIHQSFLTIFAGLPGIGKTSLVTYLAKSLGLESNERFLFIPVARGWTSQKNLLGFFNPLNGKFQPSATGMYEVLDEIQSEEMSYSYWFLLDEANLSPVEHYWSSFVAMCDNHREKVILLGDPNNKSLRIPDSVRFIATVNNDNTTELLSPRIIDRAPIITIPPGDNPSNIGEIGVHSEKSTANIMPQDVMNKLFVPAGKAGFIADEERVFNEIVKCLSERSPLEQLPLIYISPRKRNMIETFCTTARDVMKQDKYDLRAFDMAISQHVLPTINGNGGAYRKRLDKLAKVLNEKGLVYSHSMLQQIIMSGESQYHFYRFFTQ